MKIPSSRQNILLICCIVILMPLSSTKVIDENSDDVYADTEKEVVPCPGDGNFDVLQNKNQITNKNYSNELCLKFNPIIFLDRGDYKCNHDATHRVCAKLVDNSEGNCTRLKWGTQNFWEITDQVKYDWSQLICNDTDRYGNPKPSGENWCICMWATEGLINKVIYIIFGCPKIFK